MEAATRFRMLAVVVGDRKVHFGIIRSASPFNPSQISTLAKACLPEKFPAVVRVETIDNAGFLSGD